MGVSAYERFSKGLAVSQTNGRMVETLKSRVEDLKVKLADAEEAAQQARSDATAAQTAREVAESQRDEQKRLAAQAEKRAVQAGRRAERLETELGLEKSKFEALVEQNNDALERAVSDFKAGAEFNDILVRRSDEGASMMLSLIRKMRPEWDLSFVFKSSSAPSAAPASAAEPVEETAEPVEETAENRPGASDQAPAAEE
jgi:chromosome segregation ATPase